MVKGRSWGSVVRMDHPHGRRRGRFVVAVRGRFSERMLECRLACSLVDEGCNLSRRLRL